MPSSEEIFSTVRDQLVDALGLDDDEVERESTLFGDLGAESIDILDIVFRLEKAYDIKIPRGELFPDPEMLTGEESDKYVVDGKITDAGVARMRESLPHADIDKFAEDPSVDNVQDIVTVQMICNYLETKLA